MQLRSLLIHLLWLILILKAEAFSTTLDIVNDELAPNGYSRSWTLANGTHPGPLISSTKGDVFSITVNNMLYDTLMALATSIHWHGILQATTNWADGVAFVTQCPIAQNQSFTYSFDPTNQTGTYWYHSHFLTQYADGLRGPLVIYDPQDPYLDLYDVDDETTIITLADQYNTPSPEKTTAFPLPDAILINGIGRSLSGPLIDLAVVSVIQSKRYRMRIVGMTVEANIMFSIDSHTFTVIEADGISTQPVVVDSVQVFPGQRYSLILNANQTIGNYWIRAVPSYGTAGFDNGINSAILRYEGAPSADPTTNQTSGNLLTDSDLHPLEDPGAPGEPIPGAADVVINLAQGYEASNTSYTLNGIAFEPPSIPVLLQLINGVQASSIVPEASIYTLPRNVTVEISLPPVDPGGPHPIHMHGHVFDVIRPAGSSEYNFVNPARRDTVNTGYASAGDNVTIRFRTDNPGPWILHCHIDWHLQDGLAAVFIEDPGDIVSDNPVSEEFQHLCPLYYGTKTPTPAVGS